MAANFSDCIPISVDDRLLASGFVQAPIELLRLPDLSLGSKMAYCCLLWYNHRLGYWPGRRAMAFEFGISDRSVTRYLAELEEYGLIVVERDVKGEWIKGLRLPAATTWGKRRKKGRNRGEGGAPSPNCPGGVDTVPEESDPSTICPGGSTGFAATGPDMSAESHSESNHISIKKDKSLSAFIKLAEDMLRQERSEDQVLLLLGSYGATEDRARAAIESAKEALGNK